MDSHIARERIADVVRPDSITTSQGDFLATHVPIRKLHILDQFIYAPSEGISRDEEEIYSQYVLNPENRHQFAVIYGQSGTGKSHLIRWLATRYSFDKPENEVVLFISRSDNTLKGTIRQLLATPEVKDIARKDIFDRLVKATVVEDENRLKGRIYHDLINEVEWDQGDHGIPISTVKRKRLTAFLYNEVIQQHMMEQGGPVERIYSKVAEKTGVDRDTIAQFDPEDFSVSADLLEDIQRAGADPKVEKLARVLMSEDGNEEAVELASYLNQFVNTVIQRSAGIEAGDFRDIFLDIRRELGKIGKALTLFIEDITSFTGVDDALLDALVVEHTGMHAGENLCRICSFVGTTNVFVQDHFKDNHKDRVTSWIYIPDNIFEAQELYEFVGRYLNVMSLPAGEISDWAENGARAEYYPVHKVTDGATWDFCSIKGGVSLCLYPFTKNAIRYLYQHAMSEGHRTPRYLIRDLIEPTVREILHEKSAFPSNRYRVVNGNTALANITRNATSDNQEQERLMRFLSIWGDGTINQYSEDGEKFISGIRYSILAELGFPSIQFNGEKRNSDSVKESGLESSSKPEFDVPSEKVTRVDNAKAALSEWRNSTRIDISATSGTSGVIRKALEDLNKYLLTAINWQAEGFSSDFMDKLDKSALNFLSLQGQTKGSKGLLELPSNWESMQVLESMIRWREYGNQSWKYPDAMLDAYILSNWTYMLHDQIVRAVKDSCKGKEYIEPAIAAEILRMILCGEFREKSLKNLTAEKLFGLIPGGSISKYHSKEWNSLVSFLSQKGEDDANRKTVQQYFNLSQGGGSVIVLDELRLMAAFRNVKSNKLVIPRDVIPQEDPIKLRREVFAYYTHITDRLDAVSRAELNNVRENMDTIIEAFRDDSDEVDEFEIDEDDIIEFASQVKSFYDEANKAMISLAVPSVDSVKKNAKAISKAINDISEVLQEENPLTILMTFSSDPASRLVPLLELLEQVRKDMEKVDKQIAFRLAKLDDYEELAQDKYRQERSDLALCASLIRTGVPE